MQAKSEHALNASSFHSIPSQLVVVAPPICAAGSQWLQLNGTENAEDGKKVQESVSGESEFPKMEVTILRSCWSRCMCLGSKEGVVPAREHRESKRGQEGKIVLFPTQLCP